MGELPLSVAALTFNLEMVDLLVSCGACLHATNTWGDTVFHSLIRFAALYPERLGSVETAMWALHQRVLSSPLPAQPHHFKFPHVQVKVNNYFAQVKSTCFSNTSSLDRSHH